MPASKPIPFEGVLNCWNDEHDLPDLLLSVSRSGKTGRLHFSNAEADKTLYIKEGKIVFAESSSDDDGLGQHLLRVGKISLEDYVRVSKLVEPGKRLGALLVAEGVLEPRDLVPALVGQVRAIILGLFRRTESWYGFKEEEQLDRKESITLDIPVAQLILDGVQSVDSWRRVSKGVGDLDSMYRIVDAGRDEWSKLKLDSSVAELLSMLEEPVSAAQICTHAGPPDFDACRYLWAFRTLGWIEHAAVEEKVEEAAEVETEGVPEVEDTEALTEAPLAEAALDDDHDDEDDDTTLDEEDEAALVEAAAASADFAEAASEAPLPRPPRPTIPESLIQTRISTTPPLVTKPVPPESLAPAAPAAPRVIPDDLTRTQVVNEPPAPKPSTATTSPDVAPRPPRPAPKPIPDDLVHTRIDVQPQEVVKNERATLSTPSAAEMMEAILEEGKATSPAAKQSAPSMNAASTQFFTGSSALEMPEADNSVPPPPADSDPFAIESYEDFISGDLAPGFDSLSLDPSPVPAAPEAHAPSPMDPPAAAAPSFEGLALSDPAIPQTPTVSEPEPALPIVEGDLVDPEPLPVEGGGMEFLMTNDPVVIPHSDPIPMPAFSTHDPFQFGEEPVSAALPKRPRTEEMDLDMDGLGHVLRRDK